MVYRIIILLVKGIVLFVFYFSKFYFRFHIKKKMKNSKHIKTHQNTSKQFFLVILLFFLYFFKPLHVKAQFWIVAGDSAVGLSQDLFKKYDINPLDVETSIYKVDKTSKHYKNLDSLKLEIKTQKLDFNFSNLDLKYNKGGRNVFISKLEIDPFLNIDLLFEKIVLNDGAELYFISGDLREYAGPITTNDLERKEKAFLHSGLYNSNSLYVILIEAEEARKPKSKLFISEFWYEEKNDNKKARISGVSPGAACYPEYNNQSFSIGRITIPNRRSCTFSIVNNESNDRTPYMLTARHCIVNPITSVNLTASDITASNSASVVIPQRRQCGSTTLDEVNRWQATGATYLSSQWPSDHLLLKLNSGLPISIQYLGWDRTDQPVSTQTYSLHNPGGTFYNGRQVLSIGYITSNTASGNKYNQYWTLGETKEGSSGGPLIKKSDNKIVGCLSFELTYDKYYKLSNAWNTSTNPLKTYLSPNQNLTSINALNPTKIVGPAILCYNQTSTLTMPNLLPSESVTWSVSGGLQILSSTGQSVTVKANISGYTGNVTVTASYNALQSLNSSLLPYSTSYNFWVGQPSISVTNTTTNSTSGGYSITLSQSNTNTLVINNNSVINNVIWSFPSGWSVSNTTGFNTNIYSWSGSGPFSLSTSNVCGTTNSNFFPSAVATINPTVVFPNIASDEISLRFEKNEDGFYEIPDYVTIIQSPNAKTLMKKRISKIDISEIKENGLLRLDLGKLGDGTYIVNLDFGSRRESNKIIIQK